MDAFRLETVRSLLLRLLLYKGTTIPNSSPVAVHTDASIGSSVHSLQLGIRDDSSKNLPAARTLLARMLTTLRSP